jgi:hypothetical protein
VIAALIGNVLHILFKILSLIKEHKISNVEFNFKGYLKDDWWVIVADLSSSFALVFVIDEWIIDDSYTWILSKLKTIFVFVGLTGSYLVMYFFSVATKKLHKAIDYKTNIADQATGTLDKPTPK